MNYFLIVNGDIDKAKKFTCVTTATVCARLLTEYGNYCQVCTDQEYWRICARIDEDWEARWRHNKAMMEATK